jgi:hypothetical protein
LTPGIAVVSTMVRRLRRRDFLSVDSRARHRSGSGDGQFRSSFAPFARNYERHKLCHAKL